MTKKQKCIFLKTTLICYFKKNFCKKFMKNRHFFRLGTNRATVKGKSEDMLTSERREGYRNVPWQAGIRIISGVAGHQRCSAAAYNGELWGSGGKAPGSTGAGLKVLLGVGKAHGFSGLPPALIKRNCHPAVVTFLLIHYAEISLSRSGRIFSENLHPTLDNIRLLSRSEDRG